jgi:hypothetical protein
MPDDITDLLPLVAECAVSLHELSLLLVRPGLSTPLFLWVEEMRYRNSTQSCAILVCINTRLPTLKDPWVQMVHISKHNK